MKNGKRIFKVQSQIKEVKPMYHEETGQVQAETGEIFTLTVQHAGIDPDKAKAVFDQGREVGDWYWKHKVWENLTAAQLEETQQAARFFYGWDDNSEKVTTNPDGTFNYEAYYAC